MVISRAPGLLQSSLAANTSIKLKPVAGSRRSTDVLLKHAARASRGYDEFGAIYDKDVGPADLEADCLYSTFPQDLVSAENPVTAAEQHVPGRRPRHHRPDESQHDRLLWPAGFQNPVQAPDQR
jgi:hypothetical protein